MKVGLVSARYSVGGVLVVMLMALWLAAFLTNSQASAQSLNDEEDEDYEDEDENEPAVDPPVDQSRPSNTRVEYCNRPVVRNEKVKSGSKRRIRVGKRYRFRCKSKYQLIGVRRSKCLDTGLFADPLPLCVSKNEAWKYSTTTKVPPSIESERDPSNLATKSSLQPLTAQSKPGHVPEKDGKTAPGDLTEENQPTVRIPELTRRPTSATETSTLSWFGKKLKDLIERSSWTPKPYVMDTTPGQPIRDTSTRDIVSSSPLLEVSADPEGIGTEGLERKDVSGRSNFLSQGLEEDGTGSTASDVGNFSNKDLSRTDLKTGITVKYKSETTATATASAATEAAAATAAESSESQSQSIEESLTHHQHPARSYTQPSHVTPQSFDQTTEDYMGDSVTKGDRTGYSITKGDRTVDSVTKGDRTGYSVTKGDRTGYSVTKGDRTGDSVTKGDRTGDSVTKGDRTGDSVTKGDRTGDRNGHVEGHRTADITQDASSVEKSPGDRHWIQSSGLSTPTPSLTDSSGSENNEEIITKQITEHNYNAPWSPELDSTEGGEEINPHENIGNVSSPNSAVKIVPKESSARPNTAAVSALVSLPRDLKTESRSDFTGLFSRTATTSRAATKTTLTTSTLIPMVTTADKLIPMVTTADKLISLVTSTVKLIPMVTTADKLIPMVTTADKLIPIVTAADKLIPMVTTADKLIPMVTTTKKLIPMVTTVDKLIPMVTTADKLIHMVTTADKLIPMVTQSGYERDSEIDRASGKKSEIFTHPRREEGATSADERVTWTTLWEEGYGGSGGKNPFTVTVRPINTKYHPSVVTPVTPTNNTADDVRTNQPEPSVSPSNHKAYVSSSPSTRNVTIYRPGGNFGALRWEDDIALTMFLVVLTLLIVGVTMAILLKYLRRSAKDSSREPIMRNIYRSEEADGLALRGLQSNGY